MPLKIGIAGKRGSAFVTGIRDVPGAELVAACDLEPGTLEQILREHVIPLGFRRFEDMLDAVDAVIVATPMQLHAAQSIHALQAGKHVLSEVTACVTLAECHQLVRTVRETGRTYMMAENYCYSRESVLIREMARKGMFGELYYGEGEYLHDVKPLHHNSDGSLTWRSTWQVGQRGNTYPTHSFGPVMQWFWAMDPSDGPDCVVCLGSGIHTDPEHPHDDTTNTLVALRSGKQIRIRLDMMSNRPHQVGYYSLQGTQGVYESSRIGDAIGHVWIGENPPPGPVREVERRWRPLSDFDELLPDEWRHPPEAVRQAGHGGGDFFVVRDFVEAALGLRPNPIDVYAAVEWTAVGLCSQLSIAQGGAPVRLPNFREGSA